MSFKWLDAGNVEAGCCGKTEKRCKFEFSRKVGNAWKVTHVTEYSYRNNPPCTNTLIKLPLALLCNADMDAEIKISAVTEKGEVNRVILTANELQ
jgi:hypothetical protein